MVFALATSGLRVWYGACFGLFPAHFLTNLPIDCIFSAPEMVRSKSRDTLLRLTRWVRKGFASGDRIVCTHHNDGSKHPTTKIRNCEEYINSLKI